MPVVVVVVPAPVDKTPHVKRALCSHANPSSGRTCHPYDTLYRVDERARAPIIHTPTTIYTAHLLYHVYCITTTGDCECDFRNGNNRRHPMVSQNIWFHIIPILQLLYTSSIIYREVILPPMYTAEQKANKIYVYGKEE